MRFVFVAGTTHTAEIEGISAAGADPDVMVHTPSADAEIVEFGRLVRAPILPVSPNGCPTPAVVTRAVRELLGFDTLAIDSGLAKPTAAPTVSLDIPPGKDVRESEPVPEARRIFSVTRELGRNLPSRELVIGESIPGGTTTALGVLEALGEPFDVSSSLPENPLELKKQIVAKGLENSGIESGDASSDPCRAVELMGDPVLATVAGLTVGAVDAGKEITLAGGTQMVAVAALARHLGIEEVIEVATTSFIADDESTDVDNPSDRLDLDLVVTDPKFDRSGHPALERFRHGEAKEGVGMGGALMLANRGDVPLSDVRDRVIELYESLGMDN